MPSGDICKSAQEHYDHDHFRRLLGVRDAGNMTCPQTMGCWFLHEANAAFDRQLPFLGFAKVLIFDEDHSTSSPVCPDRKYSCVFTELLVSYRIAFCPPGTNGDMLT